MKILFQLNELALGGTTKAVLSWCQHLDRSQFEPFVFCRYDEGSFRRFRHGIAAKFSEKHRLRFEEFYVQSVARRQEFEEVLGANHLFLGTPSKFQFVLDQLQPEVVHFNRGVANDWYTEGLQKRPGSRWVETNIFGKEPPKEYLDSLNQVFFISEWIKQQSGWARPQDRVLYNPIVKPLVALRTLETQGQKIYDSTLSDLRAGLQIPAESFVVGRITRPGMDDGQMAYQIFDQSAGPEDFYLVIGASEWLMQKQKQDSRVRAFRGTTDSGFISKFYNSLDVLLHYRVEGETFGMNIAEAMIHAVPVVSHQSTVDNAQIELIQAFGDRPCGAVVKEGDWDQQARVIHSLKIERDKKRLWAQNALVRANEFFEASAVTRQLQNFYLHLKS